MIATFFFHPLGPAMILGLTSLLLELSHRWLMPRGPAPHQAHPVGRRVHLYQGLAAAGLLTAWGVLAFLRLVPLPGELRWPWQPLTVAGSELAWQLDGWNWLGSLLILLLVTTAFLLNVVEAGSQEAGYIGRTLLLAGAALAFVVADNVITLATCWLVLDIALALRLRPGHEREPAGQAWGLLSLANPLLLAVLLAVGEKGSRATLGAGPFNRPELALLWLSALIRIGIYPFHRWLSSPSRLDVGGRLAFHLIGPTAGFWLLGRVYEVAGSGWLGRPQWAAVAGLALLGSALCAWATEDERLRWQWIAINRSGLALLAVALGDVTGLGAVLWPMVTFGLGNALLITGLIARDRWGWQAPAFLGALVLWGMPGTVGFLAHTALAFPTQFPLAAPLFGVLMIAETLLVAALWQAAWASAPSPAVSSSVQGGGRAIEQMVVVAGLALCALPLLFWGLLPGHLPDGLSFSALPQVLASTRRSTWVALMFSGLAGWGLGTRRRQIFQELRGWQQGIVAVASLEWLYQALTGVGSLLASGLRFVAALAEGEGYLGWLALAVLIIWVLVRG